MKGDKSLPEDGQGNVLLPRNQVEAIADALLFYIRGFENPDNGLRPTPALLDDYGARAVEAFDSLGFEIMNGAIERADPE